MLDIQLLFTVDKRKLDENLFRINEALSSKGLIEFFETRMVPILQGRALSRFTQEGDDASNKWAQLSPATQQIRAGLGYPPAHPINHRTGELENFITQGIAEAWPTSDGGAMMEYPKNSASGELKQKIKLAQKGDPLKRTPARPVLTLSETDLHLYQYALAVHIFGMGY